MAARVTVVWVKRIWRCVEAVCAVSTWTETLTETSAAVRPRASLTERARREASRRVGQDGHGRNIAAFKAATLAQYEELREQSGTAAGAPIPGADARVAGYRIDAYADVGARPRSASSSSFRACVRTLGGTAPTTVTKAIARVLRADLAVVDDPDSAFVLAYDAAGQAVTALLAHQGLRPTTKGGHYAVEQAARAQFGPGFRQFGALRRRRNELEYPAQTR